MPYLFITISAIAAWTRNPVYHGVVALFFLVAFGGFIVMDGLTIR